MIASPLRNTGHTSGRVAADTSPRRRAERDLACTATFDRAAPAACGRIRRRPLDSVGRDDARLRSAPHEPGRAPIRDRPTRAICRRRAGAFRPVAPGASRVAFADPAVVRGDPHRHAPRRHQPVRARRRLDRRDPRSPPPVRCSTTARRSRASSRSTSSASSRPCPANRHEPARTPVTAGPSGGAHDPTGLAHAPPHRRRVDVGSPP